MSDKCPKCGATFRNMHLDREVFECGSETLAMNAELLASCKNVVSKSRNSIKDWPIVDGYICRQCRDAARKNPLDNREWGCAQCNGSSHSLAFNFRKEN